MKNSANLVALNSKHLLSWAYLVAQTVKTAPVMQQMWVQPLGGEDPLEKEMATHSRILAWRILQTEEPDGLYSTGSDKESDTTEQLNSKGQICYARTTFLIHIFCLEKSGSFVNRKIRTAAPINTHNVIKENISKFFFFLKRFIY